MNDTICALATATGGALGIIRVSGPQAFDAVSAICAVKCADCAPNTVHYTHIISPLPLEGSGVAQVVDEGTPWVMRPSTQRTSWATTGRSPWD